MKQIKLLQNRPFASCPSLIDVDEIDVCRLGNASEPFCLSDVWMGQVDLSALTSEFWFELGLAQGACQGTLYS